MNSYEYIKSLHEVCKFQTREGAKIGLASNGELRRWLKNGVMSINDFKVADSEELDYPILRVTLFTKTKMITIL